MSERENKEQIPTEFNAEQTLRALRKQDNIPGSRREKTVSDFPKAAALAQILKDVRFPADKYDLIKSIEDLGTAEGLKILPIIEGIQERPYRNAAEVASAAGLTN